MQKNNRRRLQSLLNRVFLYFFHNLLNLPHLSSFFPSPHMFRELIHKQSALLADLLLHGENSLKNYKRIIHLHYEMGLPQEDFIDAMDFIKHHLLNLMEREQLELSPQNVESIFHELMELSHEIYLTEDLRTLRKTWEKFIAYIPEIASDQIKLLEALENACLIGDSENRKSAQELISYLLKNVSCFEANRYFSSADFLLKSYSARDISLALQKLNEELYNLVCHLTKYIRNRNFRYAYRVWLRLSEKSKLLLLYGVFLKFKWELSKEKSLSEFILDPLFEDKLFGLIFLPTEIDKLAIRVFKIFSTFLIKYVRDSSYGLGTAFIHEDRDRDIYRCYLLYVTEEDKKKWLKGYIKNLILKAKEETSRKLSLSESQIKKYVKATIVSGDVVKLSKISKEDFPLFIDTVEETVKQSFPEKIVVEISDISNAIDEFQNTIKAVKLLKDPERENYLQLYGQPIIGLKDEKRVGIEILTRIVLPEGGAIPPYRFLKLVKKLKYTSLFDRAVLHKLKTCLEKCSPGNGLKIFVNLYPSSCYDPEVLKKLKEIKEVAERKNLEIIAEVIETEDVDISKVIPSLSAYNFKIAIDDFGTGYSNFERIVQLMKYRNLKFIKIDGSLVKKMKEENVFKVVVKNITSLAKELNKEVIYEFVEDGEILELLKEIGEKSGLAQGYFLGRPEPLEKLI